MSRLGNKPVTFPSSVQASVDGRTLSVEGPKGKLTFKHRPEVSITVDEGQISVARRDDERESKSFHGLSRAIVRNMVAGVTEGYEKRLEVVGVGYLCAISGDTLQLRVGYANELHKKIPQDLDVTCPDQTHVVVRGCDKQRVGQFAAEVRALRKPEPYKGKGVRYQGEQVKIKPGKAASK
jgi:large subunit ribosomal protein L6